MSAVLKQVAPRLMPMREPDLDRVLPIESAIYEFPWSRGNFRDSLTAGYSCWLYVDADAVIGYAVVMLAVDEAHLLNLSVDHAVQRRGHGRQLLDHVMAAAQGHGARSMLLEVRPSNGVGRHLYERAGFAQIGLRRGYYPAASGREDALVLSCAL